MVLFIPATSAAIPNIILSGVEGGKMKKQRAPALLDSANFQQLWDALDSKLIESAQGNLLYTLKNS